MYWGNKEALKLWSAKSLQDLVSRNFASDMSESTDTRLNDYLQRFAKGEKIKDQWTMYPNFGKDGPKTINCSMSGITIQQQKNTKITTTLVSSSSPSKRRLAMLVEAVYVEESKDDKEKETNDSLLRGLETLRHLPVVVRQFDLDGNLLDQNPEALKLFGTGERITTPAAPATNSDYKNTSSSSSSSSPSSSRRPKKRSKADASAATQQQQQSLSEFLQCFEDLELGKSVLQEVAINGHDCTLEAKQITISAGDRNGHHHHHHGGGGGSSNGYSSSSSSSSSSSNHSNNIKWFSIKVRRVRDPVTSLPVIIYSARDVSTIMLKAQEEADKITAKKNEFFAVMAHEIRTPLHQVVGFIELLAKTTPLSKEQTEFCSLLQTSTHALMAIINDLLDFTKLEAGKVILENIPFEPRAVIDGCVAAIQPQAESKHIALSSNFTTTQIDAGNNANDNIPMKLVGDPNRIRQILLNIVQNAVKFTPAGGNVQIEASLSGPSSQTQQSNESQINQDDDETDDDDEGNRNSNRSNVAVLRVEVEDTGIGICNAKLERIFNPYQQADASVSRTYGGTGLGLAICQSLTENMNGKIGVESQIGVGTKFWFEIPLLNNNLTYLNNNNNQTSKHNNVVATISSVCENKNNNTPKHSSSSNSIAVKKMAKDNKSNNNDDDEEGSSPLRILVAEDNKVNQKVASAMLKRLGHIPTIVENGQLAVDEICSKEQNCDYDIVLMDVQMPVLDGIDATKAIRRKGYLKSDLPIVALTASIQTVDWIQCGMNDCIKKPVRLVDLKQSLAKHAAGTKM